MGQLARKASRTPPIHDDPPFHYIDKSLAILGRTFDTHEVRLEQEFLSQRKFIASQFGEITKSVEQVGVRVQELEKSMGIQSREIEQVGGRVQELEKSMDIQCRETNQKIELQSQTTDALLRTRLYQIENTSRNFLRTRGWEQIAPVGVLSPSGELSIPHNLPRTVQQFWNLREPDNLPTLVRLSRVYGLQWNSEWMADEESNGWDEETNKSDASSEDDNISVAAPIPLETAIRQNPSIAHRALASSLGLSYDGIEAFMRRAQELRERRKTTSEKRKQCEDTYVPSKKTKGRSPSFETLTNVTSPPELGQQ